MKTKLTLTLLCALFFSTPVFAGNPACTAVGAHVLAVYPWDDGATFVVLDKDNDCGCTETKRFGFYANDQHAKTFLAEALTAIATKSTVTVYGNVGCSVHTNSPSVFTVILNAN